MASLVLFLAALLGGASIIFSNTVTAALGYPDWIHDACSNAPLLCNNSHQLGIAATLFGTLWVVMKVVSSVRD